MKLCPHHGLELKPATVTDSRGKSTRFLRCPFGFTPGVPIEHRALGERCTYARPIKLYSPEGKRISGEKPMPAPKGNKFYLLRKKSLLGNQNAKKHGLTGSPEECSYYHARTRCTNPNYHNFHLYGGRGIQFKLESLDHLVNLIGRRPVGCTLDRIDCDGHYEPGNIRWATSKQQQENKRSRKASA
jgi:hypothetical protein